MGKQKRRIYCKFCDYFCYEADDYVSHLEKHHEEMIPQDMTTWNETTHKYSRFCNNPKCKDRYREFMDIKKRLKPENDFGLF